MCLAAPTGGGGFNEFILRNVDVLAAGGAISLRGIYTTTGSQRISPLDGSAIMGSDGQIRIGFFVHSTAQGGQNDFTVSGLLDAAYNGTVNFDNDGDFKPKARSRCSASSARPSPCPDDHSATTGTPRCEKLRDGAGGAETPSITHRH